MIRNIILDIGNVVTDFRWKEFLVDKGFDRDMIKRIAKASVETPLWNEFDRGAVEEEEVLAYFIKQDPEIENELHEAFDNIKGMVTPRDYAISWVKDLKDRGFMVYYLSNFSKKATEECSESLEFLPLTDGGILSYREKLIKPEPAIYELLMERYGLVAGECVFFDDTVKNVEAAERLGIHGVVFTTLEAAEEELARIIRENP